MVVLDIWHEYPGYIAQDLACVSGSHDVLHHPRYLLFHQIDHHFYDFIVVVTETFWHCPWMLVPYFASAEIAYRIVRVIDASCILFVLLEVYHSDCDVTVAVHSQYLYLKTVRLPIRHYFVESVGLPVAVSYICKYEPVHRFFSSLHFLVLGFQPAQLRGFGSKLFLQLMHLLQ